MPKPPLPDQLVEMLKRPNAAVMATVRPDGTPISVATWYLWEDGRILLNLDAGRKRLEHLRANPRASVTVLDTSRPPAHKKPPDDEQQLLPAAAKLSTGGREI